MTTAELVEKFLRHCQRSGAKPATLRQYRTRLRPLVSSHGSRPWSDLDRETLLDWLHLVNHWQTGDKAGTEKAAATQRLNLIAIQMLQSYAQEFHGHTPQLQPRDLKKPAGAKRETFATPEQTRQILAAAPPDWARVYRVLRLTGARPMELTGADIASIEGDVAAGSAQLVITDHKTSRKTGTSRKIPIGKTVAPLILEAIGDRESGPLFLDARGKRWTVPRLSATFRRLRDQLELPRDLVLYSARHEFGTAVMKKFGLLQAKELLGHADISTTQRYTHLRQDELREYQQGAIEDLPTEDDRKAA